MSKFIDVSPRRLRQLAEAGIVPKAGRGRYSPFEVTVSYIRFLRDRVQSPEASDSEFFAVKLAKLRAEREQIELQNQLIRKERIPIDDVNEAVGQVFGVIRGIVKANLSVDRANEVFDAILLSSVRLFSLCTEHGLVVEHRGGAVSSARRQSG
jgi:hypothetical protein